MKGLRGLSWAPPLPAGVLHLCVQPDAHGSHPSQNAARPHLNSHPASGRPELAQGRQRCQAGFGFKEGVVPLQPASIHSLTQSQSYFSLAVLPGLLDPSCWPHPAAHEAPTHSDTSSPSLWWRLSQLRGAALLLRWATRASQVLCGSLLRANPCTTRAGGRQVSLSCRKGDQPQIIT